MTNFAWPRDIFLNLIGLDSQNFRDGKLHEIELAEGAVDPRSGGAVAVRAEATLDGNRGADKLLMKYWRMRPNGEQLLQDLIDIEFHSPAPNVIAPSAVWVMGRKIYDRDDDDYRFGDTASAGGIANVNRVMAAVQRINLDMRQGKLPEIAKIFAECHINEAVGESLTISGLGAMGGFDFDATEQYARKAGDALRVPAEVVGPLLGFGVNSLDRHQRLEGNRPTAAIDPATGNSFIAEAIVSDRPKAVEADINIQPLSTYTGSALHTIPNFASVYFGETIDGQRTLEALKILNVDMKEAELITKLRAVGTMNRMLHDFRRRDYPVSMDHLTEYDLGDLTYTYEAPPPLKDGGRLVVISLGGNNFEEVVDGYGTTIGGNCKLIIHEGLDEHGKIDRVAVVQDLGLHLHPSGEPNLSATADLVPHMSYIKRILMSHRHLDHTDGKDIYIAKGFLKNDIVIDGSAENIRVMRQKMRNYPGITEDLWPAFNTLEGQGWIHVEKDGIRRISIGYSTDGTPHSARCTPFGYAGRYGAKVSGLYLNHGDARFGRHNAPGYKGEVPDSDWLDKNFFQNFTANLVKEDPSIDPAIAKRRPTLFDVDTTSITKKGWADSEQDFRHNLVQFSNLVAPNMGIIFAQISTNDNRFESGLSFANTTGRDVVVFGANLEDTATTMNVLGVNRKLVKPRSRQNIQAYLDHCFQEPVMARLKELRRDLRKEKDRLRRKEILKSLKMETRVLQYFGRLKDVDQQKKRYQLRSELESALKKEFHVSRTLGSIRVARSSQTSKDIISGAPDRRFISVTGTQNSFAEVDATLTRLAEGRSLFDARTETRGTARPLKPNENVIIISQTAIPGNEQNQQALIEKLTQRGFTVVSCVGDGIRVHNLPASRKTALLKDFRATGHSPILETDGSVLISTFPLHASGHGQEEDARNWLNLVRADYAAAQHTSDPRAAPRLQELAKDSGLRTTDRQIRNFEVVAVEMGESPQTASVRRIGRLPSSLINIKLVRKMRQYFGGHVEATRVVRIDSQGGLREDGLKATARADGFHQSHFATIDGEKNRKAAHTRKGARPMAVPANRTMPVPERSDAGPQRPGIRRPLLVLPLPGKSNYRQLAS